MLRPHWVKALDRTIESAQEYIKPLNVHLVALERIELIALSPHISVDEMTIACEVAYSIGVPRAAVASSQYPTPEEPETMYTDAAKLEEVAEEAEVEAPGPSVKDVLLSPFRALADAVVGGVNYVYTSIEDYVNAQIAAREVKEAMIAQKSAVDAMLAPALLEVDVAQFQEAVDEAKRLHIPNDELAAHVYRIKEATLCQTALKLLQSKTAGHILAVPGAELDRAIVAARAAQVPEVLVVTYVDYSRYAKHEQLNNPFLQKLRQLMSVPSPLHLKVPEVKASLKAAAEGGVPKAALDPFEAVLRAAEAKQAERTILDVVTAVSDPQTMLSVNTEQLRAMLKTMNRAQAESAFKKLEDKLDDVDAAQAAVKELEELGWPKDGVLKVGVPKMRMVIDTALAGGVPPVLMNKYKDRMAEAKEGQELLKRAEELGAQIKAAKAGELETPLDETEIGQLKAQLDAINLSISVLSGE